MMAAKEDTSWSGGCHHDVNDADQPAGDTQEEPLHATAWNAPRERRGRGRHRPARRDSGRTLSEALLRAWDFGSWILVGCIGDSLGESRDARGAEGAR